MHLPGQRLPRPWIIQRELADRHPSDRNLDLGPTEQRLFQQHLFGTGQHDHLTDTRSLQRENGALEQGQAAEPRERSDIGQPAAASIGKQSGVGQENGGGQLLNFRAPLKDAFTHCWDRIPLFVFGISSTVARIS